MINKPPCPWAMPGNMPNGYTSMGKIRLEAGERAEMGKRAKELLGQIGKMNIGEEAPYEYNGIKYIRRVEPHWHDYPVAGADVLKYPRPYGWHKGITVYKQIGEIGKAGRLSILRRIMKIL